MGSFDPWLWTVPSPTQCTLTREQWPVPSLFYARISLSIPPCHAPTKPSQAAWLAVWPLRAYNRGRSKLLEVSPAFMIGPLAWGPLNMRWLMFSVGWGWGDSARMDGPRASSYRMPRCGRLSDVITGSPSKCAPTLAEQSCLHEGRETPTAFAHVSHRGTAGGGGTQRLNTQMWFLTRKALQASCWPTWDCPLCIHDEHSEKTCCWILLLFCNVNRHGALKWQMRPGFDKALLSPMRQNELNALGEVKGPRASGCPAGAWQEGSLELECSQFLKNGLGLSEGWVCLTVTAKSLSCSARKHLTKLGKDRILLLHSCKFARLNKETWHATQFKF